MARSRHNSGRRHFLSQTDVPRKIISRESLKVEDSSVNNSCECPFDSNNAGTTVIQPLGADRCQCRCQCQLASLPVKRLQTPEPTTKVAHSLLPSVSEATLTSSLATIFAYVRQYSAQIEETLLSALLALLVWLLVRDAAYNRLGTSNGRFISFVDTCLSVMSYRDGLPRMRSSGTSGLSKVGFACRVVCGSFCMKFTSGIFVSLCLGVVPVPFKSYRHPLFVAIGLALIWLTPLDAAYIFMRRSNAMRLVLLTGGGLYKLRKAVYAVEAVMSSQGPFWMALVVVVLAVDGNTLSRRGLLWLERCVVSGAAEADPATPSLRRDSPVGVWRFLVSTFIPLTVVTAILWYAARECSEETCMELRIVFLGFFVYRNGAFAELYNIHLQSMRKDIKVA